MATKYEYYTTGDNQVNQFYNQWWAAQTFTVGPSAHTITSVKVKLWRTGATPGTVYVGIRATSGNHPTGSDLTSGSMDGATITTSWNGAYYEIPVTELTVDPNTKYAIVLRAPNATGGAAIGWAVNNSDGYSGGNKENSTNSGASWTSFDDADQMFEVWGNTVATPISASDSGVGSDTASIGLSVADSGVGTESDAEIGPLATDAGVGAEAVAMSAETAVLTDAGVGVDNPAIQGQISGSDSGVGVETTLTVENHLPLTDAGVGSETSDVSASVPVAETGADVETPGVQVTVPVSDSAVGSELVSPTSQFTVTDSGILSNESVTTPGTLIVTDEGKGAEFAWRVKPSSTMIDALALPHVLSIKISDPATMSDKKVQGGSLPRRKMVGKSGRTVEVGGWSDSQIEIDAVDALRDGLHHTFYPPTGDSFSVLVTGFEPNASADEYNRRTYRLSLAEAN
jgi:hypothetical protein